MLGVKRIHHVAIICTNYEQSKRFYVEVLGFTILQEVYRAERQSYKLDLEIAGQHQIELFRFLVPPPALRVPKLPVCAIWPSRLKILKKLFIICNIMALLQSLSA